MIRTLRTPMTFRTFNTLRTLTTFKTLRTLKALGTLRKLRTLRQSCNKQFFINYKIWELGFGGHTFEIVAKLSISHILPNCILSLPFDRRYILLPCYLHSLHIRETMPLLSSDMGKKTVSVLAYSFLLPQRACLGYILSISRLRYSKSWPYDKAQISFLEHILSTWSE